MSAQRRVGAPVAGLPRVPESGGVDAVAAWSQDAAQRLVGHTSERARLLRGVLDALGRTRAAALDCEALLTVLAQRGEPVPAWDGPEPPDAADCDGVGEIAIVLWQWREVARCAWAVGVVQESVVAQVADQGRQLAACVRARPTRAADEVRRRLRLPRDAREVVRDHEETSARLEAEALDAEALEGARRSLVGFAKWMRRGYLAPPHIQIIAEALERVDRGECKRLIVMLPPRSGKSWLTSELFAAWYIGRHPDRDILAATLSQNKADDTGRDVRNMIKSEEYQRVFPGVHVADDSQAAARFHVVDEGGGSRARRGVYKGFGRTGRFTGNGANLLLMDDMLAEAEADSVAANAEAHRAARALRSRLAPKSEGAAWVIINTRYREDDLIGYVLKEYADDGPWEVLRFPALADEAERHALPGGGVWERRVGDALWPERYSKEEVEAHRAYLLRVSPMDWWGQYMCSPIPASGAVVDAAWLRRYGDGAEFTARDGRRQPSPTMRDVRALAARTVVSVDTSKGTGTGAARTAMSVWIELGEHGHWDGSYLVEAWAEAVGYTAQVAQVKALCARWRPNVLLIEDKSTGEVMCQTLPDDVDWVRTPIEPIHPVSDKVTRMSGCTAAIRDGQVWVPAAGTAWAPWLADWEREITFFPLGRHKDQADAFSQFLNWRRENPLLGHASGAPIAPQALCDALGGAWYPGRRTSPRNRGW